MERKKEYEALYKPAETDGEAIERLKAIISVLRRECPWDREQDHQSLRSCMLEEAYESVDAIERGDMDNLEEELGDVLLQVVFHGNLAEEAGNFDLKSVINRECEKMIRRHPHVFGEKKAENEVKSIDNVLEKWENIKESEGKSSGVTERLRSVPHTFPALTRAAKVQKKAADVGFDWDSVSPAADKIREELDELTEAYLKSPADAGRIREELGDLLFSVVNTARFLKVDPEEALRLSTDKFIRRFAYIEDAGLRRGKTPAEMTLQEMDDLWREAKSSEKQ